MRCRPKRYIVGFLVGVVSVASCSPGVGTTTTVPPEAPTTFSVETTAATEGTTATDATTTTSDQPSSEDTAPASTVVDFGEVSDAQLDAFVDDHPALAGAKINRGATVATGPNPSSVISFWTEDVVECRSIRETLVVVRPQDDIALEWLAEPSINGQTTCEVSDEATTKTYRICDSTAQTCDTRIVVNSTVFSIDFALGATTIRTLDGVVTVETQAATVDLERGVLATVVSGSDLEPANIAALSDAESSFMLARDLEPFAPIRPEQSLQDTLRGYEWSADGTSATFELISGLSSPQYGVLTSDLFTQILFENFDLFPGLLESEPIDDLTVLVAYEYPAASELFEGLAAIEFTTDE